MTRKPTIGELADELREAGRPDLAADLLEDGSAASTERERKLAVIDQLPPARRPMARLTLAPRKDPRAARESFRRRESR